jgi:hypothetical protein
MSIPKHAKPAYPGEQCGLDLPEIWRASPRLQQWSILTMPGPVDVSKPQAHPVGNAS